MTENPLRGIYTLNCLENYRVWLNDLPLMRKSPMQLYAETNAMQNW